MPDSDSDKSASTRVSIRASTSLKGVWKRRVILATVPVALVLLAFGADRLLSRGRVLRGVTVGGLAATGVDTEALRKRVTEVESRLASSKVALRIAERVFHVSPAELGFRVDAKKSADRAMLAGRTGSVPAQFGWWLSRWWSVDGVGLEASLDSALVETVVSDLEPVAIPDSPFAGAVEFEGGSVRVAPARSGRRVDRSRLVDVLVRAVLDGQGSVVEVPLVEVKPSTSSEALKRAKLQAERLLRGPIKLITEDGEVEIELSREQLGGALQTHVVADDDVVVGFATDGVDALLAKRRKRLEAAPKNAEIEVDSKDRPRVVPGRPGTLFSASRVAEALVLAAYAKERVGVLPLLRGAQPQVTTDDLLALKIKGLVSRFTTFHPCCRPRVDNIHRIADLLNGAIVKPGEYFSVNAHVGPRTTRNGFVAAPTIELGEMVDALGGGASQFATTFFNALFYGGYDIVERQPHSYYFSRYPMGIEATLSFPKPDIIFRNDTAAGMYIRCEYTGTSITVKIFGDNGGRKVRATRGRNFDIEKPPVELLPDPELDPDREKVKEAGQTGWSLIVGRIVTYPDGTKKEEKRKVIYKPRVRRIEVHPCRIPEGEEGHTGEKCPVPEAGTDADLSEMDPEE